MSENPGIDEQASAFAARHGSFTLHFDAAENYGGREPCPLPWALIPDADPGRGWGGTTAREALEHATAALGDGEGPGSVAGGTAAP